MRYFTHWMILLILFSFQSVAVANSASGYSVRGVAADDYLNVREDPSVRSPIVTKIPHDAKSVRHLGDVERIGRQVWWRIKWQGKQGWVNKRYLVANQVASKPAAEKRAVLQCGGNEPFWGIKISKWSMEFSPMDGEKIFVPIVFNKTSENHTKIAAIEGKKGNNRITTLLEKRSCNDGMSDRAYDYAVSTIINGKRLYSGCCHVKR